MRFATLLAILVALGCGPSNNDGNADGGGSDGGNSNGSSLTIISPVNDAILLRDTLTEVGRLVAPAEFVSEASSDIVRVEYTIAGLTVLGDGTGPDFELSYSFDAGANHLIEAYGYNDAGVRVADSVIRVRIGNPPTTSCYDWLDVYGIDYSMGPASPGIPEPVTVTTPINGIHYRYIDSASRRTSLYATCDLIVAVARMAPWLREHDIVEVTDIGIYNYRCIGGDSLPNCPNNGFSEHAYARALDIAALVSADGTEYNVLEDWINDAGSDTCANPATGAKNEFLHEFICAMKAEKVFNILLTANFNSAHDNHFHVDLTPGGDYLRSYHPAVLDEGGPAH